MLPAANHPVHGARRGESQDCGSHRHRLRHHRCRLRRQAQRFAPQPVHTHGRAPVEDQHRALPHPAPLRVRHPGVQATVPGALLPASPLRGWHREQGEMRLGHRGLRHLDGFRRRVEIGQGLRSKHDGAVLQRPLLVKRRHPARDLALRHVRDSAEPEQEREVCRDCLVSAASQRAPQREGHRAARAAHDRLAELRG